LTYDDRGWLTVADDSIGTANDRAYAYDALRLRTQITVGGVGTNYVYDSNWRYLGTSFTTLPNQRKYDILGNMIADSSLGILQQQYDYRNQLVKAWSTSLASGAAPDTLDFIYDQTQKRITKRNWYQYWSTCGGGGSIPPVGFNTEPKMQFGVVDDDDPQSQFSFTGPGGGEDPCLKIAVSETHYLYDAGVLVATFDESDNVRDLFVNGPSGRIASYQFNDSAKLIYYLNDHLGSPRGIVMPNPSAQMVSYTHFYPFGGTLESWTSGVYNQFLYTGKERDQHGAFDYYYFGARYYDTKTGTFTSYDKAGQFPGGFRYGNDPIRMVDPDGNLFFLATPFVVGFALGAGSYAYAESQSGQFNFFDDFLGMVGYGLVGGLSGAAGAALAPSTAIGGIAAGSTTNSFGTFFLTGGESGFNINVGFGSFADGGFRFNNPVEAYKRGGILGAVSSGLDWLAVGSDISKLKPFRAETAKEMQARQLKDYPKDMINDLSTVTSEVDLRDVDLDAVLETTKRGVAQPYKGKFAYNDGTQVPGNLGEGAHRNQIRFGGNLHLDRRILNDPTTWIWHYDAFGSGLGNSINGLLHPIFESLPATYLGDGLLGDLPYNLYVQPRKY
jgi:RHS repeat-associated protein